jgi:predicted component of type VI protein secretion system
MSDPQYFLKKKGSGSETEIQGVLTAGRGADSGLRLTQGNPSRNHARLSVTEGALYVEDLTSTNGTFINGQKIEKRTRLAPGDKLRFDLEEFVVRVVLPPAELESDEAALPAAHSPADGSDPPSGWQDPRELAGHTASAAMRSRVGAMTDIATEKTRRKRTLLIAGLSFLGTLLLLLALLNWFA